MKYNGELKIIDTQDKAYLLGQIYGDGYNGGEKCHSYKVVLTSNKGDIDVYRKLQERFPFFTFKTYKSHPNMIYLENHEKSLYIDLKEHGMISSKTKYDKTGEFHFPNLKDDLIPHFIRGYFDADGSFWYPSRYRSRNNLKTELGCATKKFLLSVNSYLLKNGIIFSYLERSKNAGNSKTYQTFTLLSSNRETSLKFADFIYKDANIFLSYKKEKAYRPLIDKEIFKCPYCNSNNVIKNGTRNTKIRLFCKECNKNFTIPMPTQEEILDE